MDLPRLFGTFCKFVTTFLPSFLSFFFGCLFLGHCSVVRLHFLLLFFKRSFLFFLHCLLFRSLFRPHLVLVLQTSFCLLCPLFQVGLAQPCGILRRCSTRSIAWRWIVFHRHTRLPLCFHDLRSSRGSLCRCGFCHLLLGCCYAFCLQCC